MNYSVLPHRDALSVNTHPGLYINGRWVDGDSSSRIDQLHPATSELVATLADASPAEVELAVRAAREAFDLGPWPRIKARERKLALQRLARLIDDNADELSRLQTLDNGIPVHFSLNTRVSARNAVDILDHYIGWIDKMNGETFPQFTEGVNLQYLTLREPVGVVAAIIPWNAPLMMFMLKVAPALATGCTMVMKPSENASLCALRMAQLIHEAGIPAGVFNLVTGGPTTGDALVKHPGVDKVTFTGSRIVGGQILAASGSTIKRTTLELGGKSAAIVFPDAPSVAMAATTVMAQSSTFLAGQVCSTTSRALVHESVLDEFIHHAREQVKSVKFGDPFDLTTTTAPLINRRQADKVLTYITTATNEGARLEFGGDRPAGDLAAGNWVNPTLFSGVSNWMTVAQEEIFGPVLAVIPFKEEEEAIRMANDSIYGLAGGIYTTHIGKAFRVAKAMRTGAVGINGYSVVPNAPAGGVKQSGLGREGGWATIEAFTEVKTVMVNLGV
jgi:aldehyde dehydrogenase (NAD+)